METNFSSVSYFPLKFNIVCKKIPTEERILLTEGAFHNEVIEGLYFLKANQETD